MFIPVGQTCSLLCVNGDRVTCRRNKRGGLTLVLNDSDPSMRVLPCCHGGQWAMAVGELSRSLGISVLGPFFSFLVSLAWSPGINCTPSFPS
jgi:hypothetical protein